MAAFVLGLFRGEELDRLRERLAGTPATPPGEVSPGPVAVEGVAREHRETVESPVAGREALLVQYRRHRPEGDGSPAEERTDAVPFVVEDETGRVLLDPRDAVDGDGEGNYAVFSERNTRRHYGGTDAASATPLDAGGEDTDESGGDPSRGNDAVAADGTPLDGDRPGVGPDEDWRDSVPESAAWIHAESAIRPGDTVYVVGDADETPGGSPPFVVTPGTEGIFLVSDLGPAAVREQLDRESGPLDRSVLSLLVLGVIAVLILVAVLAVAYTVADALVF
jgi:hypothetical protein